MKDYCVELKVCEGCGALFLRSAINNLGPVAVPARGRQLGMGRATTCQGCATRMSELPPVRERRRRGFELRTVRRCAGSLAVAGGAR